MAGLLEADDITAIFEAVCNVAAAGGLWSSDTQVVVTELARALTIEPKLPEVTIITTTVIEALPEVTGSVNAGAARLLAAMMRMAKEEMQHVD